MSNVGSGTRAAPKSARTESPESTALPQPRMRVAPAKLVRLCYTLVHAAVMYTAKLPAASALFFLKINNLGDRKAFNASSIDTIRALAPLPGRGVKAGVQLSF